MPNPTIADLLRALDPLDGDAIPSVTALRCLARIVAAQAERIDVLEAVVGAHLNTAAGRPSNAESPVAYCWRCGGPGGDDHPTVPDPSRPGEHRHFDCD